jgi:hypothetical protein
MNILSCEQLSNMELWDKTMGHIGFQGPHELSKARILRQGECNDKSR